jgi:putative membrane protein
MMLAAGSAHAFEDEAFLNRAMEIDLAEISFGLVAQERARDSAVREYGSRLVLDHVVSGAEVIALSRASGLSLPTRPSAGDLAVLRQLMDFEGDRFDEAFATRMVVDHEEAIALFEEKAAEETGDVAAYAVETLVTLKGHLQLAEELFTSQAPLVGATVPREQQRPMADTDAAVYPGTGMADTGLKAGSTEARQLAADDLIGVTL